MCGVGFYVLLYIRVVVGVMHTSCCFCYFNSAMEKFRGLDKRASTTATDTDLDTTHQNAVT